MTENEIFCTYYFLYISFRVKRLRWTGNIIWGDRTPVLRIWDWREDSYCSTDSRMFSRWKLQTPRLFFISQSVPFSISFKSKTNSLGKILSISRDFERSWFSITHQHKISLVEILVEAIGLNQWRRFLIESFFDFFHNSPSCDFSHEALLLPLFLVLQLPSLHWPQFLLLEFMMNHDILSTKSRVLPSNKISTFSIGWATVRFRKKLIEWHGSSIRRYELANALLTPSRRLVHILRKWTSSKNSCYYQ